MTLTPTEAVSTYDMSEDATGLAAFIEEGAALIPNEQAPIIYVRNQHGADAIRAVFERETLTDGSHVYNLILHFDE